MLGTDVVPSVRLSPNDRNRVAVSLGGPATTIEKAHDADAPRASVAMQATCVDPTGNDNPDGGAHVTATGAEPPMATGAGFKTATGCPVGDEVATGAGQAIDGPIGSGPVESPQAAATAITAARRTRCENRAEKEDVPATST